MSGLLSLFALSSSALARQSSLGGFVRRFQDDPGSSFGPFIVFLLMSGLIYYAARKTGMKVHGVAGLTRMRSAAPQPARTEVPAEEEITERLRASRQVDFVALRSLVPGFSEGLFLDMARGIYTKAQRARAGEREELLDGRFSEAATETLFSGRRALDRVCNIIPARTRIISTATGDGLPRIVVAFTGILTEDSPARILEVERRERWSFQLAPGEGDPIDRWYVASITRVTSSGMELPGPGWDRPEVDFRTPARIDPHLDQQLVAFEAVHPGYQWRAFEDAVRVVFQRVQEAIATQDPGPVERLLDAQGYDEIAAYVYRYNVRDVQRHRADAKVRRVQLCRLDLDDHFEVATVRIQALLRDWVVENGRVIGGDKDVPRKLAEYWTFQRPTDGSVDWRLRQIDTEERYIA